MLISKTLQCCLFVTVAIVTFSELATSDPIVTIEDGTIQGREDQTVGQGKTYYAFQGIPYAKPPVGPLRFMPPVKNDIWNGILLATSDKSQCVQNSLPATEILGSEDCLYINVYKPLTSNDSLSVMVWIHGGGFLNGNSSYALFGPDYFLDEGVIFVSLNYRLNIAGFLSTEDLECPGNNGLKDQVFALKWVQRNIKYFGGDPNKVTVFGESAGAASVSYLQLSPTTAGLFNGAISQSGTAECLWAFCRNPRRSAFAVGALLGIFTTNSSNLIARLRQTDYQALQQAANTIITAGQLNNSLAGFAFGPVTEPYHETAFFSGKSDVDFSQGNYQIVPTIIGLTRNEAAGLIGDTTGVVDIAALDFDLDFRKLAPADLTSNPFKITAAAASIRLHYFNILPIGFQRDKLVEFFSDDQFARSTVRTVNNMRGHGPVYFYVFSYEGLLGLNYFRSTPTTQRTIDGPGHVEDLGYMFRTNNNSPSDADILIRSRMIRWWTNFAKYSNPTPVADSLFQNKIWQPAGTEVDTLYLDINTDLELRTNPFNDAIQFYNRTYATFGDPPYDTY